MDDCPSRSELEDFLTDRLPVDGDEPGLDPSRGLFGLSADPGGLDGEPLGRLGTIPGGRGLHSGGRGDDGTGAYPLPSRIGPYRVIRVLGQGGMGVVYLAEQAALKRLVALKVIRHGVNATPAEVARFRAEAEAVARLQHPNIVQIHEVGEQDGVYYLVLEYVDGGSLDRQLAGTPREPRSTAGMIETLARAVHHAHGRGILHRDLKPANVLLDAQGQPKVTDFGMAKSLQGDSGLTASGQVLGTPSYIAPEQASGKHGEITPAVDVYGLGALLYEMLTGRPPFKGATPLSTLEQVMSQEPVAPSRFQRHIPRDLETICLKCLEKQPSRRYATAEALADDLGRFLSGRPIAARPVGAWGRARKWARRRPIEACLTAAVLVVAVLGLSGIVWQWRNALAQRDTARQELYRANLVAAAAGPAIAQQLGRPADPRDGARAVSPVGMAPLPQPARQGVSSPDRATRVPSEAWLSAPTAAGSSPSPRTTRCACGSRRPAERSPWPGGSRANPSMRWHSVPDGRRLASGGVDGSVLVWDAQTGAPLGVWRGHAGPVEVLAFSPDGRRLVSTAGCAENASRLWDAATGTLIAVLPAPMTTLHPGRHARRRPSRTVSFMWPMPPPARRPWRHATRADACSAWP